MNFLIRVHLIFFAFIFLLVIVAFIAKKEEVEKKPYTPVLYTLGTPVPKNYSRWHMEHDLLMYCGDLALQPHVGNPSAYGNACRTNEAWGKHYIGYGANNDFILN